MSPRYGRARRGGGQRLANSWSVLANSHLLLPPADSAEDPFAFGAHPIGHRRHASQDFFVIPTTYYTPSSRGGGGA